MKLMVTKRCVPQPPTLALCDPTGVRGRLILYFCIKCELLSMIMLFILKMMHLPQPWTIPCSCYRTPTPPPSRGAVGPSDRYSIIQHMCCVRQTIKCWSQCDKLISHILLNTNISNAWAYTYIIEIRAPIIPVWTATCGSVFVYCTACVCRCTVCMCTFKECDTLPNKQICTSPVLERLKKLSEYTTPSVQRFNVCVIGVCVCVSEGVLACVCMVSSRDRPTQLR